MLYSPNSDMDRTTLLDRLNVSLFQQGDVEERIPLIEITAGRFQTPSLAVFRSGTFRDSLGIQHTWEPEHLAQMVFHFDMLRNRNILPNVPFRVDHTRSAATVIGYISALATNEAGTMLNATVDWTEGIAAEKISSGTFRSRSAEIGLYETNDEAVYWPVFMGCAFVDIPAVEGLYAKQERKYVVLSEKEFKMPETQPGNGEGGGGTPDPTPPPPDPTPPPPTPDPPPPEASHGAGATASFRVNGQPTTDLGAVQGHIDTLETFRRETLQAARTNFVQELARTNRIAATQLESMTAHAQSLNDAQWDGFRSSWENAPAMRLLGNHGGGVSNPDGDEGQTPTEIETLEGILAMHKRAGMKEEDIEKTPSFKKLTALRSTNGSK